MFGALFGALSGFVSGIFSSSKSSTASKMAHRYNWSQGARGGTDAAMAFANITNAHSDPEEIVEEFEMDAPGSYPDPELDGMAPYDFAYEEMLEELGPIAMLLECDPEDLIDEDELEERAYDYACDFADRLMTGTEWIPDEEFLDWAFYDLSDHNG